MKRFNELVVIVVFLMIIFAIPILSCFGKDKVGFLRVPINDPNRTSKK